MLQLALGSSCPSPRGWPRSEYEARIAQELQDPTVTRQTTPDTMDSAASYAPGLCLTGTLALLAAEAAKVRPGTRFEPPARPPARPPALASLPLRLPTT